jgi:uncharacterized membrane-anchored protein YhcB (DUF1043 family)
MDIENTAWLDAVAVALAIGLVIGAFAVMFNGVLTKVRDR